MITTAELDIVMPQCLQCRAVCVVIKRVSTHLEVGEGAYEDCDPFQLEGCRSGHAQTLLRMP
eukprot:scaffold187149_cov19-Prasinocladus_malaysianus.AAC.1